MITSRQKQLVMENKDRIRKNLTHASLFLMHFYSIQQDLAYINGRPLPTQTKPAEIDEFFECLKSSADLEALVLCLINFGYYSIVYNFFDELDLDSLSIQHKQLWKFDASAAFIESEPFRQDHPDRLENAIITRCPFERHRHLISHKLESEPVLAYFSENNFLSKHFIDTIRSITSSSERNTKLVHYIKKDPQMVIYFYHALLLSAQFELFAFLVDTGMDWRGLDELGTQRRQILIDEWECHLNQQENIAPSIECIPSTSNDATFEFSVDMADSTIAKDLKYYREDPENIYKNFSVPKGLVLIINNKNFNSPYDQLSQRKGSEIDEERLVKLFTDLGYSVPGIYNDLTDTEMLKTAKKFSQCPEHEKAHSCVVVVMTHGQYDRLAGSNGYYVNVHDFIECFNSKNAPLLAGKPKLIIIQACRGDQYDYGVLHPVPIADQIDSLKKMYTDFSFSSFFSNSRTKPSKKQGERYHKSHPSLQTSPIPQLSTRASVEINRKFEKHPTNVDIIIAYATTPNNVSWRNSGRGSWFIQSICEVFGKHAKDCDIFKLLTLVQQKVAKEYESSDHNRAKQSPEWNSRLSKQFYIFPGVTSEE